MLGQLSKKLELFQSKNLDFSNSTASAGEVGQWYWPGMHKALGTIHSRAQCHMPVVLVTTGKVEAGGLLKVWVFWAVVCFANLVCTKFDISWWPLQS